MLKDTVIKEEAISTDVADDSWLKMGSFSRVGQVCIYLNSSYATGAFTGYISGSQEGIGAVQGHAASNWQRGQSSQQGPFCQ